MIVQWELAEKRTRLWPSTAAGVLWSAWFELELVDERLGQRLPVSGRDPPRNRVLRGLGDSGFRELGEVGFSEVGIRGKIERVTRYRAL